MITHAIVPSVNDAHLSLTTLKLGSLCQPLPAGHGGSASSRRPKQAVYIHGYILLGGGSAAVELAPATPHRRRIVFLALAAFWGASSAAVFEDWARPRSGELPGRAVWFAMSLIRPRPPHANVFQFSKARR